MASKLFPMLSCADLQRLLKVYGGLLGGTEMYEDGGTGTAKPAPHAKQRAAAESNGAGAHAVGDDF